SIHFPTQFTTGTTRIGLSFRWSFTGHVALVSCEGCFAKDGLIHNLRLFSLGHLTRPRRAHSHQTLRLASQRYRRSPSSGGADHFDGGFAARVAFAGGFERAAVGLL